MVGHRRQLFPILGSGDNEPARPVHRPAVPTIKRNIIPVRWGGGLGRRRHGGSSGGGRGRCRLVDLVDLRCGRLRGKPSRLDRDRVTRLGGGGVVGGKERSGTPGQRENGDRGGGWKSHESRRYQPGRRDGWGMVTSALLVAGVSTRGTGSRARTSWFPSPRGFSPVRPGWRRTRSLCCGSGTTATDSWGRPAGPGGQLARGRGGRPPAVRTPHRRPATRTSRSPTSRL